MGQATLYGSSLSLYSGRARSYLIKANVPYREVIPGDEHFLQQVLPQAGNRRGLPTLETDQGTVIRDGAAIIDHYEAKAGGLFSPTSPRQKVLSRLFDVIGAEGLLRPAMHYRWNFPTENLEFLRFHFRTLAPIGPDQAKIADENADRMRAACMAFGAVPDTFELVESLYAQLLQKLDAHFSEAPYLLGGKPSIGDFGLIAPMFGHLGRDPKPLSLMQSSAIRVFRWVERMNRPEPDMGEFPDQAPDYSANDQVSQTLIDLLQQLAIDFVPETRAAAHCVNDWLAQQGDALVPGTEALRGVGMAKFSVDGVEINALAQPYRFFLLQRVQDEYDALDAADKQSIRELFQQCGMADILTIKLARRIGRENNLEVWL